MAQDNLAGLNAEIESLRTNVQGVDALFEQLNRSVKGQFDDTARSASRLSSELEKGLSSSLRNVIKNGGDFAGLFEKIGSAIEDVIIQMGIINPLVNSLFRPNALSSNSQGVVGSLLGGVLGLLDGRAGGGPVNAGIPYMVGERGPELFVPQVAGRINSSAAGGPVSVVVNISTPDVASFRASQSQIAAQMLDNVRRAQRIR